VTDAASIADELLRAHTTGEAVVPFTARNPQFALASAYAVLREIARRREADGWRPLGRKIGFTNTTIWELYGVDAPMWAHVWDRTVTFARDDAATVELGTLREPRIEPEVVFKLKSSPPATDGAVELLAHVEWMAPGFEIVWSPYPGWKFALADAAAAFGLHGYLVVGTPVAVTAATVDALASFTATLSRNGEVVERGIGANVLGSPALALGHLATVLAAQLDNPPLQAGELITTGTITNAHPVAPGETWSSDYGELGLARLTLQLS
jgi:2-oxo-3-hexenedioate decarboxylase